MTIGSRITEGSVKHYKAVAAVTVAVTALIALAAGLPSVFPRALGFLHGIEVDTDPENMLSADEPARVFHNRMKERLELHDMVVVGVVNDGHPQGAFNPQTLKKVHELTEYAKTLRGERIGAAEGEGVIVKDVIAPSTVDAIIPDPLDFPYLLDAQRLPKTQAEAERIRRLAQRVPFLNGTVVSEDGKAIALYLPLTSKDLSYRVYERLQDKVAELGGPEAFHITGLPVAEDTFGVEMFIQMAISAPAAMVVIFLLMLAFFRKPIVILSPMIVALVSVVFTMGLLILAGFPIHIMSSMIPIFIMPIAVLDSIHIISEFFEKYQATRDREKTIREVMAHLFSPMLYTSLTSAAGFASLALTPIPPVQVFGVFVALGIIAAWLLTVTFIPAFVMFIHPRTLENFGAKHAGAGEHAKDNSAMGRFLRWVGRMTYRRAKPILAAAMVVLVVAGIGISLININDNPVKWFTASHPIRVADRVLNEHFGGTYMAYLAMSDRELAKEFQPDTLGAELAKLAAERANMLKDESPAVPKVFAELARIARMQASTARTRPEFFQGVREAVEEIRNPKPTDAPKAPAVPEPGEGPATPPGLEGLGEPPAPPGLEDPSGPALPPGLGKTPPATQPAAAALSPEEKRAWDQAAAFVSEQDQRAELFKEPAVLEYQVQLQKAMARSGIVGKSNSLADIVRTVRRDFVSGKQADFRVPKSRDGVGQMLIQYESSHRKDDLWHFVTKDYRTSSIWVQLRSGDNQDMSRVAEDVKDFIEKTRREQKAHPDHPVHRLEHQWFGLTYINVIWQEKMVTGMLQAFAGSFLVVFLLMTILFRSALWGLLSMIPLTVTIAAIYGAVGLIGKDYDMPVAVLSSLTLGLAVDFAIHFLARARSMYAARGSWKATAPAVFGEPARAIMRNIIVIAAGFLPLLLAPLVPYKTVGVLLATILLVSGVGTLLLLPALMAVLEKRLFAEKKALGAACNCVTCGVSSVTLVVLVAMALNQSLGVGWAALTWVALAVVPVMALTCGLMSRREKCRLQTTQETVEEKTDE